MSPLLKKHYTSKQCRMAFYIVENEINNEENPPDISAVIGLDKELEVTFYASKKAPAEKPALKLGTNSNKVIVDRKVERKEGMHCPSLPTQWRNHLDIIIPKAEFGHFSKI